jgi:hypothetical protein
VGPARRPGRWSHEQDDPTHPPAPPGGLIGSWARRAAAETEESGGGRARDLRRRTLAAGALSVLLAVFLEVVQVAATIAAGGQYRPGLGFRDVLLKLPWALLVCLGLWLGIAVSCGRPASPWRGS